ncbi:MAG: RND transporter [Verrucomicrobia bacterium]|nr:MAG: RND transporter [Verrucomicrobiota bacterium]
MDKQREGISARKRRNRLLYVAVSIVVVSGVTYAVSRLENAAPRVDLNTVWVDTVRRGPMVREVRGIGKLVPREVRWIPANTIGRVERIVVLPGSAVEPDDIIVEMSNSVLVQDAENAVWQLKGREADLINLKVQLEGNLLQLMSGLAQIEAAYKQAQLEAEINEELYADGLVADLTLKLSRVRAEELETRLDIERRRLSFQEGAMEPQIAAMEADVEQFRAQANLLKKQVASLHVRAGASGVLQRMSVEEGQQITLGESIFQVVDPSDLKAVIRVPETQARDVQIGQSATVDTRNGVVVGEVTRVDPNVENGTVAVDIHLDGELPRGSRPNLTVEGRIELENLADVLFVGRPAFGRESATVAVFRFEPGGDEAVRTSVLFGRMSVSEIEVVEGLQPGDRIILSDTSNWDDYERLVVN